MKKIFNTLVILGMLSVTGLSAHHCNNGHRGHCNNGHNGHCNFYRHNEKCNRDYRDCYDKDQFYYDYHRSGCTNDCKNSDKAPLNDRCQEKY